MKGATFKVTGRSDYGTYYEKTATSDENGNVVFDGLEKGTYTLTEIDTPDDYVLNTEKYTVTIDEMNNFTISGSHMTSADNKYEIYNEPKHSFYFTKKDKYNNQNLGGAKFKLYGTSNIGNTYDEIATSVAGTGIVTFETLESGTYFLKEIKTPDTDEVTYVPDERQRIVEVFEDGRITLDNEVIWPLSERNENNPYIWYNTRNKGQITITKKWVDNLTNDQREEPKIYISTKRGELAYSKVYFRTADITHSIIDYVTSENVTAFKRNISLSEQEVLAKNPTRLDNDYSDDSAEYKIYAWLENGTVYWWTKADRAVLPANLDYYFQNETDLTDIKWSTIYRNGFWTGTPGSEEIQTSVTNMQNMFYGCTSMENLDISIINNSAITEETKANMQYVFGNNGENPEETMEALKYITIGDNFKLFDTSVLPKGKWKNQTSNEKTQNTSLTGNLPAGTYEKVNPIELIGQTVPYVTSLNGVTLDNWKVFDVEDDYVYLIYGDYMPNSAVAGRLPNINTSRNYVVNASRNRKNLINAMTTKSNWNELLRGTINGTAIDYTGTTDTKVYANGSPTLELWIDSWNKVYPDDMLYTAYKNNMSDGYNGNYVGTSPNPTSTSIYLSQKAGYQNPLYYPHTSSWDGTYGYWLASPSAYATSSVMFVGSYGGVNFHDYNATGYAFRPLVCLPSSVLE